MQLPFILAIILSFGFVHVYSQDNTPESTKPLKCNVVSFHFVEQDTLRCTNGISFAAYQCPKKVDGLSLSLLGSEISQSTGISINGIYSGGSHNGLSINGICNNNVQNNGVSIALLNIGDFYSGLTIGGFTNYARQRIQGLSFATFYNNSPEQKGIALSLLHNSFNEQSGVAISVFNKAEELHGFQFGLLNFAGNNRKLFQWLPFFNFNLRKRDHNPTNQ